MQQPVQQGMVKEPQQFQMHQCRVELLVGPIHPLKVGLKSLLPSH